MQPHEHQLLVDAQELLRNQSKLVTLPSTGTLVIVGDIHGDLQAVEWVFKKYLKPDNTILFLGDYVDRGPKSHEAIMLLLKTKLEHPKQVHLLMGNHESWKIRPFIPAEFWLSLSTEDANLLGETLIHLPLAASADNGLLAVHGAPPDIASVGAINDVLTDNTAWRAITWGDLIDEPGLNLGTIGGRPQYGREYFDMLMERFQKTLLVHGHQHRAPLWMFGERCLTLFTSCAYEDIPRRVGILDLAKSIRTSADVRVEILQ